MDTKYGRFYKISYIFDTSKCAKNDIISFEVYDGFIGQKILKLWRQESWPFGPNPAQISIPVPLNTPTAGIFYNDFAFKCLTNFLFLNREPLKILNDTKLILNMFGNFLRIIFVFIFKFNAFLVFMSLWKISFIQNTNKNISGILPWN